MEHLDVLIVGAGISGIGAGCHLTMKNPEHTFAIIEDRDALGGTWDLFRYPGIRSDSDMYTFGYSFRPWKEKQDIASGASILQYLEATASEYSVDKKIRYRQRLVGAEWSTSEKCWTATVDRRETGEQYQITCNFLLTCTGYFRYEHGYLPEFEGYNEYSGTIAHPQHWPDELDYHGKKILVIGSGATAVTLVPALAKKADHVTLLQRSPGYVFSRPAIDVMAVWVNRLFPEKLAYRLMRARNILMTQFVYSMSRRKPERVRRFLRDRAQEALGSTVDVDTHFNPRYKPWDQRMCLVPDDDLFKALRSGSASIVTDQVDRFTSSGVRLASGTKIEADIIIPATGLIVRFLDGIALSVDGVPISFKDQLVYRGMMFNELPNFASVFGYAHASWTLKVDVTCDYLCRLLHYMKEHGFTVAAPSLSRGKKSKKFRDMEPQPLVGLSSGYIQRVIDEIPKQGSMAPWRNNDNFIKDIFSIRHGKIDDGVMTFS